MYELNITSNERASSMSGSITTNGGINVTKNIYVNEDIDVNDINVRSDSSLNNVYANIIRSNDIIPNCSNNCSLGNDEMSWKKVFTKSIDITDDISFGSNNAGEPLFKIDPKFPEHIIINSNIICRSTNGDIFFKIKQDTRSIIANNMTVNNMCVPHEVINAKNVINISKPYNILINKISDIDVNITHKLPNGSLIKFVSHSDNEYTIKLHLKNNAIHLNKYDWIELLIVQDDFIYTGGSVKPKI